MPATSSIIEHDETSPLLPSSSSPSSSSINNNSSPRAPTLPSSSAVALVTKLHDDDGVDNDDAEGSVMTSPSSSSSCWSRQWWSTYVPLELLLLGYAFSRNIVVVLTGFYFFDQASHMYGDPSMSSLNPCSSGGGGGGGHNGSSRDPAEILRAEKVQTESIQLSAIAAFSGYITAVLPVLFLGPLTDRVGRRLGFVCPLVGVVARSLVFLFVLAAKASPYFVYIGTVLEGVGGSFGSFYMTTFSVAADVHEPGRGRALRICIIEAVQVLGAALATFVAGQWRQVSYTYPVMLAAVIGLITLMFALWAMPETHPNPHPAITTSTTTTTPAFNNSTATQQDIGTVAVRLKNTSKKASRECLTAESGHDHHRQQQHQHQQLTSPKSSTECRKVEAGNDHHRPPHRYQRLVSSRNSSSRECPKVESGNGHHREEQQQQNQIHAYTSFSPTGHRLSSNHACFGGDRNSSSSSSQREATTQVSQSLPSSEDNDMESVVSETFSKRSRPSSQSSASSTDASCNSLASRRSLAILVLFDIRKSWRVYFRSETNDENTSHPADRRSRVLVLCFVCFILTVAVNFSKPAVENVFILAELCWDAVQETEFDAGWLIQHWVFIFVFLHVVQNRFKLRNVSVAMVGCASAFCAPLFFSFATLSDISERTANVLVFVSAGSGTLARLLIPMLRSMSSAEVSLHEQGALFASYACVELAGAAIFNLGAAQIYKATVDVWKGVIFIVMCFFFVVVFVLLIMLSMVQRRGSRRDGYTDAESAARAVPEK